MEEFEGLKIPERDVTKSIACWHTVADYKCMGVCCDDCIFSNKNKDALKRYSKSLQNQTEGKEMETEYKWKISSKDTIIGETYCDRNNEPHVLWKRVAVDWETPQQYYYKPEQGTIERVLNGKFKLWSNKNPNQITVGETKPGERVIIDGVKWQRVKGGDDDSRSVAMVCQYDYVCHYTNCSIPCERVDK